MLLFRVYIVQNQELVIPNECRVAVQHENPRYTVLIKVLGITVEIPSLPYIAFENVRVSSSLLC